ncbi:MAG: SRPBCC family protein [Acidimicrobiales bacterium]
MTETNDNSLVIERSFDAPAELIWQMWTDPAHFASWYGPMGASIPTCEHDVQVGGKRLVCMQMQTPNGEMQMWFAGEFLEVVENQRLVYTDSMSDENGNAMPAPEGHPGTTQVIVELEEVDGKTKMTMTHVGVDADSPGAMGWNMAIDKLTTHVGAQ